MISSFKSNRFAIFGLLFLFTGNVDAQLTKERVKSEPYFDAIVRENQRPKTEAQSTSQSAPQPARQPDSGSPIRVAESKPDQFRLDEPLENTRLIDPSFFKGSKILAVVAGTPIFAGDIVGDVNREINRRAPGAPDYIIEEVRPKLMQQFLPLEIERRLVYVEMMRKIPKKAQVESLRQTISDQFEKIELPKLMKETAAKSREELEIKLRTMGTSMRMARDRWVDQQLVSVFIAQTLDTKPEISRGQLLAEYNKRRESYAMPARVRFEQLVISFAQTPNRKEAWKKIATLGNQIVYGASFSAIAKEQSQGLRASEGGRHDWLKKGSLNDEKLNKLLFELPLGELSDIVETKIGFHIIRVLEREEAGYVPFSKAQAEIRKALVNKKRQEDMSEFLKKLKREIPVTIEDPDVKKYYEDSFKEQ